MTSVVGAPIKRFEDPTLLRGSGTFVEDIQLPGTLHAAVLHSPYAHANIRSIDVAAAASLPGVVMVVTADDLADTTGEIKVTAMGRSPNMEMHPPPHPILARGRVRYVGEAIAVVIADTSYVARDGVDLIRVEYETLPVLIDTDEALKDEIILHEDLGTNVLLLVDEPQDDVDDTFRQADKIVRGRIRSQRVTHAPMEGRGVVAHYDTASDRLTVWDSTQLPHADKAALAFMLGREPRTIRVIAPDVGGGFGGKSMRPDMAAVCHLAIKLERPIKCIEDRSENFTFYHSRGATCDAEVAVKNDGTILGIRYRLVWDTGAYFLSATAVSPINLAHRMAGPYKTPLMNIQLRAVATNKPSTGAYRSAGGAEAGYFSERTMDLIASDLGISPVEVRLRNLVPTEAMPHTTPTGYKYDSGDYAAALDLALKMAGYEDLLSEQAQARAEGRLVGIGVATYIKSTGGDGPLRDSNSRVEIEPNGHVNVYTEASPHGQGTETTFAQIAADALGINPEDATVLHGDTDMLEFGSGTAASRGVLVSGSAVYLALHEARKKMAHIGADLFGCPADDVVFGDGHLSPKNNPQERVPFGEVAARAFSEDTLPPGMTPDLEFTSEFTLVDPGFPYGAQIVLVDVDRDTGEVKLLRHYAVHDQGIIINPVLTNAQHHGGLAQGIGQAITEGIEYGSDGQPLASTFMDYGILLAEDLPEPVLENTETPSPTNPLQAKGAGEISTTGTAG